MKKQISFINRGLPLQLLVSGISFLLLYSRRPDAVENPQFWAEDIVWYRDAYNLNFLSALLKPNAGYLQTLSRLIAALSQLFPLAYAPLIFNAAGFAVEISIVNFILSKRFSKIVPSLAVCFALAAISLIVPHSSEAHVNLTNSQWHLAILSFLVVISYAEDKIFWKIFDVIVVIISALTGPFCVFLLPLALIVYWKRREKWTLILSLILAVASIIQIYCLTGSRHPAPSPVISNSWNLIDIVCGQVLFSAIFGGSNFLKFWNFEWKYSILISLGIISLILIIYSFIKSQLELNLFIIYASAIITSAIVYGEWAPLAYPLYSERYWLIPITCYLSVIVCLVAKSKNLFIKSLSIILLILSSIGIYSDWRYQPYTDFQFQKFAREFENAPSGTEVQTWINPDWTLTLRKK